MRVAERSGVTTTVSSACTLAESLDRVVDGICATAADDQSAAAIQPGETTLIIAKR
jgi:hypothetical protein